MGNIDVGSNVNLNAPDTSAESISRVVSVGGEVIARGRMTGRVPGARAHLECVGLLLSDKGRIYSIPELDGQSRDLDMSHEAAVGRISEEELEYLMSRGLSSEQATSVIVRGFLDVEIKGLPEELKQEIKNITQREDLKGASRLTALFGDSGRLGIASLVILYALGDYSKAPPGGVLAVAEGRCLASRRSSGLLRPLLLCAITYISIDIY